MTPPPTKFLGTPYLQDPDLTIWNGDVREVLCELPEESVQMCVTSPPYWGLRDYGTGAWEGGDTDCDHAPVSGIQGATGERANRSHTGAQPQGQSCSRCGAVRVDNQLGLEPTPEAYVEKMVEVFREVRRVLRKDGVLFLNLGDSYNAGTNAERKPTTTSGPAVPSSWKARSQSVRRDASAAPRDDVSRDKTYTAPRDSTEPGFAYLDLCGECADALLPRNQRSDQPLHEAASRVEATDRDRSRLDSAPATSDDAPPDAPASTSPESSEPPPALCWRCDVRSASVSLRVAPTSSLDVQGSDHKSACNDGTSESRASLADHNSDTETFGLGIPIFKHRGPTSSAEGFGRDAGPGVAGASDGRMDSSQRNNVDEVESDAGVCD